MMFSAVVVAEWLGTLALLLLAESLLSDGG